MTFITIDGKTYDTPTKWEDVSVKLYFDLLKCTSSWKDKKKYDLIELYSIITGCPRSIIEQTKRLDVNTLIDRNIKFLEQPLDVNSLPVPEFVRIKNQHCFPAMDLQLESFGQKMSIDSELVRILDSDMSEMDKRFEEIVVVCCIYFYKQITGDETFDLDKALKERKWIEQAPITKMYPIAVFFSNPSNISTRHRKKRSHINRTLMKWRQALNGFSGTPLKP